MQLLRFFAKKPHFGPLYLWSHSFGHYPRSMTISENGDKNCFENLRALPLLTILVLWQPNRAKLALLHKPCLFGSSSSSYSIFYKFIIQRLSYSYSKLVFVLFKDTFTCTLYQLELFSCLSFFFWGAWCITIFYWMSRYRRCRRIRLIRSSSKFSKL